MRTLPRSRCSAAVAWATVAACAGPARVPPVAVAALPRWEAVDAAVRPWIEHYRREFDLPTVTIGMLHVDPASGATTTWSAGFGGPADAVLRVGSISKMVTAVAAMRLVEQGRLGLDVPVDAWLAPDLPRNPFGAPVTLRHLLGHRAGVVREAPVGSYFDASEPTLAATVASLGATDLRTEPGRTFRYSNPGYALVGALLERVTGQPFPDAVHDLVLAPLALHDTDFRARQDLRARQVLGRMWTYDGRAIPTPDWQCGCAPAIDLRSTAADLVHFARLWLPQPAPVLLTPATLAAMAEVPPGDVVGAGLGCFRRGHGEAAEIGHDGQVHGCSAMLRILPARGLAVAVLADVDAVGAVVDAIAGRALAAACAVAAGPSAPPTFPRAVGVAAARALAGSYRCGPYCVELREHAGELYYDPDVGMRTRLRMAADDLLVSDDRLSLGERRLRVLADGRLFDGEEYYVRDDSLPAPAPPELLPLLGEYGGEHATVIVYEQRGRLGVLADWLVHDLPEPVSADHYVFPPGMYDGDDLRFERDRDGAVVALRLGAVRLLRQPEAAPGGFRIRPRRPIAELLAAVAGQEPPAALAKAGRASDLVDLAAFEPSLRFDLRYAGADNFLGAPVYPPEARALLQRPAATALQRVQLALARQGLGLLVFDAYRPWSVTKVFWEATPTALRDFVADPAQGSRHNRGCAVDLTLCELATGAAVGMPSDFDEFTPRAYPDYPGGTSRQRWYRDLLRMAMAEEGFAVNASEWWHFDFADWQAYGVGNAPVR